MKNLITGPEFACTWIAPKLIHAMKTLLIAILLFSCTAYTEEDTTLPHQEDPKVELPQLTTTFKDHFPGTSLRQHFSKDTTTLVTMNYNGWDVLFKKTDSYKQSYLDTLDSTLEKIETLLPPALLEKLKPHTTLYLTQRDYSLYFTGEYHTLDRIPVTTLIHINGYPTIKRVLHELMHMWDHIYLRASQYCVSSGLHSLYINAKKINLWPGEYAMWDYTEYFAEMAMFYFLSPTDLQTTDPMMFEFVNVKIDQ